MIFIRHLILFLCVSLVVSPSQHKNVIIHFIEFSYFHPSRTEVEVIMCFAIYHSRRQIWFRYNFIFSLGKHPAEKWVSQSRISNSLLPILERKTLSRNVVFWISKFMQNSYVNFNGNGQMRCRRRDSSLMRRQLDWWVADATRHRRHRPLDISKLTTGVAFGDGHVTVLVTGLWEVSNDSCRYVTDLITQMLTVIRLLKVSLSSPRRL